MERNVSTRTGVKKWSETRWLGSWNPDDEVGLYLHAGRFRHDVEMWWAQTVVYLPDGQIAVDRSWGRAPSDIGVSTSVFDLHIPESAKRITSRFDGAMEITTARDLAEHPRGSGGNSIPVKWELEAQAIRPQWDMYDHLEHEQGWARGGHTEQHHVVRGEITVGSDSYRLDGPGFDDHSHGIREWDGFGSHVFLTVPFDDFGLHLIAVQAPDGNPLQLVGAVTRQRCAPDPITEVAVPLATDLLCKPREVHASITTRGGETLEVDIAAVHGFPMTITDTHNDNINGLDWNVPGNPLMLSEAIGRYTTAGGQVGYGLFENSVRRDRVDRDSLAVRDPWVLAGAPS